jgi:hypothetical protein
MTETGRCDGGPDAVFCTSQGSLHLAVVGQAVDDSLR